MMFRRRRKPVLRLQGERSPMMSFALRLSRAWYAYVEHHRSPRDEGLDFYDRMRDEFARLASDRGPA
jgi:hypothetical protein